MGVPTNATFHNRRCTLRQPTAEVRSSVQQLHLAPLSLHVHSPPQQQQQYMVHSVRCKENGQSGWALQAEGVTHTAPGRVRLLPASWDSKRRQRVRHMPTSSCLDAMSAACTGCQRAAILRTRKQPSLKKRGCRPTWTNAEGVSEGGTGEFS